MFHHVDNEVLTAVSPIKSEVMAAAVEIANLAAKTLDCDLNRNLFLTLADHLQFAIERTEDGAYTVLYTIADGLFYFLPVMLAITAACKFKMSEFTALGIGVALVYPIMVALTGGDVLGSVDLGFFGTFSWYATFLGIPIIMPASGYTGSVIPVLLMADMKVGTWGGAGELALFGDVATKDVDKAVAVRRVVEYLGADMADTVAMGDANVDIPVFEVCATSVCMGSGGRRGQGGRRLRDH